MTRRRVRIHGKKSSDAVAARLVLAPAANPRIPQSSRERGHYDELRVGRSATSREVRIAYLKRALETHPDKGGNIEDFKRVLEAFEVLSDGASRAVYDNEIKRTRSRDGDEDHVPAREAANDNSTSEMGRARLALETYRLTRPSLWNLSGQSLSLLTNLLELLQQRAASGRLRHEARPPPQQGTKVKYIDIIRRATHVLYEVRVAWRSFEVKSQATRSLEQAVQWQICLLGLRDVAVARLRARENSALENVVPAQHRLLYSELEYVWKTEPCLNVSFRISHEMFPWMRDLEAVHTLFSHLQRPKLPNHVRLDLIRQARGAELARKKESRELELELLTAVQHHLPEAQRQAQREHEHRKLMDALNLDRQSAEAAVTHLRRLPPAEITRRVSALLAPYSTAISNVPAMHHTRGPHRRSRQHLPVADLYSVSPKTCPLPLSSWLLDWPVAVALEPVLHLNTFEIFVFQACSSSTKGFAQAALWSWCKHFAFPPPIATKLSRRGRRQKFDTTQAWYRWTEFLSRRNLDHAIERLDCCMAPQTFREDARFIHWLRKLPRMQHIVLPRAGWSDMTARNKLIQVNPEKVTKEFKP